MMSATALVAARWNRMRCQRPGHACAARHWRRSLALGLLCALAVAACSGVPGDTPSAQPGTGWEEQRAAEGASSAPAPSDDPEIATFAPRYVESDVRYFGEGRADPPAGRFIDIAATRYFSCGVRKDRDLVCWGDVPVAPPVGEFSHVSLGSEHGCALSTDQSLACWAWGGKDHAGVSDAPRSGSYVQISVRGDLSCALRDDGVPVCWGDVRLDSIKAPSGVYTRVHAGVPACALTVGGALHCWGAALADAVEPPRGTFSSLSTSTLEHDADATRAEPAGAAVEYSCAIRDDRRLACWAAHLAPQHDFGQVQPPDGEFTQVATGVHHACALGTDGSVTCWGRNDAGQVDPVERTDGALWAGYWCIPFPRHLPSDPADALSQCAHPNHDGFRHPEAWSTESFDLLNGPYTEIWIADATTCAAYRDEAVACWGAAADDLFDDALFWKTPLRQIDGGRRALCYLNASGQPRCLGTHPYWSLPEARESRVDRIAIGDDHGCLLRENRTIRCWGLSRSTWGTPTGAFAAIDASGSTTCALRADGVPVCWGPGPVSTYAAPPGQFVAVAAAGEHGRPCGIDAEGAIRCWGSSTGAFPPEELGPVTAVSLGETMSCGVGADANVTCWMAETNEAFAGLDGEFTGLAASRRGHPYCGLLLDGSVRCTRLAYPPSGVEAPAGAFTDVAVGAEHACGIRQDGFVACWGSNAEPFLKP